MAATARLDDLTAEDLRELLVEAVGDADAIDYELAEFVLGRVGSLKALQDDKKRELVQVVLQNVEHLYPIAASIASFFVNFSSL